MRGRARRRTVDVMSEHIETAIIGGGQAGLATAYHLRKLGRSCVVLEAGSRIGDSWRSRWPSLHLYSPARYDGLPGMRFPAPRHSFPSGAEMGNYLEAYAQRFELPVEFGVRVDGLSRNGAGYVLEAGERRLTADNVVVASGVQQRPFVPGFAAQLDPSITQLHSAAYRDPAQLQEGPVLVVGASHSGADIAFEVAPTHRTILAGRSTGQIPFRLEGRPMRFLFPLLRFLAMRVLTMSTPIGRKLRAEVREHGGPLLRVKAADLDAAGVERVTSRVTGVVDGLPVTEDGRALDVRNVVWCTGFRNQYDWIKLPIVGPDGFPEQERGVVATSPGLYFVGMLFLHSFSSMLILGTGRDAGYVARHISAASRRRTRGSER
jgi:putative flavoprotein involved in K+ transport